MVHNIILLSDKRYQV